MSNLYERKNGWEGLTADERKSVNDFSEGYKEYLNNGKTERLCCANSIELAKRKGFRDISEYKSLKPGDKVIINNRGKSAMFVVMGEKPLTEGINLVAAHIDSPRLDLKQNPLYEDIDLALFKTHYYGGIKKYQWTAIPLAIHGVAVNAKGEKLTISVGEEDSEPVFCVTDLLPHLADEQVKKPMHKAIEGEGLNILAGSIGGDTEKNKVKAAVMDIINKKYGLTEEDFLSAEIEAVPAGKARDIGFDKSLIGSYGQDDRVCAYCCLEAVLKTEKPAKTAVCFLADKEEVGSMGNTGMRSAFFEDTMAELINLSGQYSSLTLRRCFANSVCLSADVGAAMDPNYKEVSEYNNAPLLGFGTLLTKYTGARGKSGSSDASAELVGFVRKVFNDNNVKWQIGEMGKVDAGGGGTVAQYIANLNVETIDCGVPVLSMHSPFEVTSKLDVYMTHMGYIAFMNSDGKIL